MKVLFHKYWSQASGQYHEIGPDPAAGIAQQDIFFTDRGTRGSKCGKTEDGGQIKVAWLVGGEEKEATRDFREGKENSMGGLRCPPNKSLRFPTYNLTT